MHQGREERVEKGGEREKRYDESSRLFSLHVSKLCAVIDCFYEDDMHTLLKLKYIVHTDTHLEK